MSLRCGRIRYTNALPLYAAFDCDRITFPGSLHAGVPSGLNAKLLSGELDLSPVSVVAWARDPDRLALLPDICIGARDEVMSVVLASPLPPRELGGATIHVTSDSESGFNLLRVLLERRYNVRPRYRVDPQSFERARDGRAALLIGDAAIDAAELLPADQIYDLGKLWHQFTGQDAVFAVWCARREAYERDPNGVWACMRAFALAREWWGQHAGAVAARAQQTIPRPKGFYERYYRALNFDFDAAAQSGLSVFVRELHALGAIAKLPPSRPLDPYVVAR